MLDFKIDFLNEIPVIWTVFSSIAIAVIYYFAVQKNKPFEPVTSGGGRPLGIASAEA